MGSICHKLQKENLKIASCLKKSLNFLIVGQLKIVTIIIQATMKNEELLCIHLISEEKI